MRSLRALLRARLLGLARGLRTWPDRGRWLESGLVALLLAAVAAPLAWLGGLVEPGGPSVVGVRTVLVPFLAPALLEEAVFRGLLLPHPRVPGPGARRPAVWWAVSLALYVASHPLAAALVRTGARGVFDAPVFLLEAALLGVATTVLYRRSGSLWPGVLLHGALVAAWLNLGGWTLLGR